MVELISIIIVNWNSGSQLAACLRSIVESDRSVALEIIIVDNNSSDSSHKCALGMQNVRLVEAAENLGFAKACNLGAEFASGENLLFLNPDACLNFETLKKTEHFLSSEKYLHVGIFGAQLENESGDIARSCARFPSPMGFLAHAIGLNKVFPLLGSNMAEWPHNQTKEVDQVIGAFFMVRRSVFDLVSGFDENFFVYFEEVDFSRRAKSLGWSTVYMCDVHAFHAGGGSSGQIKAKRLFYSLRSRVLYCRKHFSKSQVLFVIVTTFLFEFLSRLLLAVSKVSWASFGQTIGGYLMLIKWAFRRKSLNSNRTVN